MRRTVFTIGEESHVYLGYTRDRLWNGWACPSFEVNEALAVMKDFNKTAINPMLYDELYDRFIVVDSEGMQFEQLECWKGRNYETEDGIKHLYDIGAAYWIWEDYGSTEIKRFVAQRVEEFLWEYDKYNYYSVIGTIRDAVVDCIAKQFNNLETYYKAVKLFRTDGLSDYEVFEQLGGILKF